MTSITSEPAATVHLVSERGPARPGSLEQKLRIPSPGSHVVRRHRVTKMINEALCRRVTLVCAPEGSGKTIACASWAADRREAEKIVWVTVDAQDSHEWFWAYVSAGLRQARVAPSEVIHSLEDASAVGFPLCLVGAAHLFCEPVVLVLDDVHEVTDEAVLAGLAFLIRHAPPALRLVLSGRRIPAEFQLGRLRAAELADIGAEELACTADEADEFLAGLGIDADAAERDALLRQTEGWIAGLRLAALRGGRP